VKDAGSELEKEVRRILRELGSATIPTNNGQTTVEGLLPSRQKGVRTHDFEGRGR
jgi:hypothetical protein